MPPIATREILACRDTLAAGFSQRFAGMIPGDAADVAAQLGLAPIGGVAVTAWVGHDHQVETLAPIAVTDLHAEALALAWRDGAWDMRVLRHPPLDGQELMVVANRVFADPVLREQLLDAAQRGSLVSWTWLPMRAAPMLRRRAHQRKDRTLRGDGGRDGGPPAEIAGVDWSRSGGCESLIRLGDWSDDHRPAIRAPRVPRLYRPRSPRIRRATPRQRAYIVRLRHGLGRHDEPLPAALTLRDASALIDTLLAEGRAS